MDQLKAQADALGPLLPKRNILFKLRVEVANRFGCMAHPEAFQTFRAKHLRLCGEVASLNRTDSHRRGKQKKRRGQTEMMPACV